MINYANNLPAVNMVKSAYYADFILKKCTNFILKNLIVINIFFLEKYIVDFFFRNYFYSFTINNVSNYKIFNFINILVLVVNACIIYLTFSI